MSELRELDFLWIIWIRIQFPCMVLRELCSVVRCEALLTYETTSCSEYRYGPKDFQAHFCGFLVSESL